MTCGAGLARIGVRPSYHAANAVRQSGKRSDPASLLTYTPAHGGQAVRRHPDSALVSTKDGQEVSS
jgi:hypothetical protein